MLCDNLEGWDRENGREAQVGGMDKSLDQKPLSRSPKFLFSRRAALEMSSCPLDVKGNMLRESNRMAFVSLCVCVRACVCVCVRARVSVWVSVC